MATDISSPTTPHDAKSARIRGTRVLEQRNHEIIRFDGSQRDAPDLRQRRFRELENLPKDDQDTAVKLIDALVAKGKIKKLVV